MTRLPRVSGRECLKALEKAGFTLKRQHGSHFILHREVPPAHLVVPDHKELDRGTLRAIIRQSGMSLAEFLSLL
jgi:predicted RNA binding protein YcfA (HicA-like mRNA interferase family)